mmetsp:Transcript_18945/g.55109  ORF Transcript_18945/g.55109 Transcript_18945/m.55109 type:complete len:214 (-) Transcript_18945:1002-1643(-)
MWAKDKSTSSSAMARATASATGTYVAAVPITLAATTCCSCSYSWTRRAYSAAQDCSSSVVKITPFFRMLMIVSWGISLRKSCSSLAFGRRMTQPCSLCCSRRMLAPLAFTLSHSSWVTWCTSLISRLAFSSWSASSPRAGACSGLMRMSGRSVRSKTWFTRPWKFAKSCWACLSADTYLSCSWPWTALEATASESANLSKISRKLGRLEMQNR